MRPFCELHQMYHIMPGDCDSMRRHGEAVRRETARQNVREGRARRISDEVLDSTHDGRRLLSGSQLGWALVRRLMERAVIEALKEQEKES